MPQLIAGNWKMHMLRAQARELASGVRDGAQGLACELLVCPPFTAIETVAGVLAGSSVAVGAQDCHPPVSCDWPDSCSSAPAAGLPPRAGWL